MEIKKEKDSFEKNKYKFENVSSGKIGKEKDGFLFIGKKDLARIHGRQEGKGKNRSFGNKQGKKKFNPKKRFNKNKK